MMPVKPFITSACLLSILVLLCGCPPRKDKPQYLDLGVVNYFDYQKGSYWVFYDQLKNRSDTFTVTSVTVEEPYSLSSLGYERTYINIEGSFDMSITLDSKDRSSIYMNEKGSTIQFIYEGFTQSMPFRTGRGKKSDYLDYNQCTYVGTASIGNKTYSDVYKIENTFTEDSKAGSKSVYYIDRDHGILSISVNTGSVVKELYLLESKLVRAH